MAFVHAATVPLSRTLATPLLCTRRCDLPVPMRPAACRGQGRVRHARMSMSSTSQSSSSSSSSSSAPSSSPTSPSSLTLQSFLDLASTYALSTVRFISVTPSSVLETIGRLDYAVTSFMHPTKGPYLTLASSDKMFELHINVTDVRVVTLTTQRAKLGDHDIHVIRLLGEDDRLLLSVMLQYDPSQGPGHYLAGAVEAFDQLRHQLGSRIQLAPVPHDQTQPPE